MKNGARKALVLLLTLSMLMSMMAVPGFAGDEGIPSDQPAVAETVTEENTEAENTDATEASEETEAITEEGAPVVSDVEKEEQLQQTDTQAASQPAAVKEASVTAAKAPAAKATTADVDEVLAEIGELSNDPRDFSADDKERIEAIYAKYEALSADDQATINKTFDHPSGDGQSYGRVLEAAVWAVRSFGIDTSTTLEDGTYTTTTTPAVSSESNKGMSDSSRVRNWWVEKVVVENGQATAYIYVTSGAATAKKLTSYPSVWAGGQSIARDSDNTYPIPVDLNGTTYFGGVSSSMPRPIMYTLNTTIEEPAAAPEKIELAITNNTGMFKAVSAYLITEGEQEYLVMALSGSGYAELYKGTYDQAVANGDGTADKGNDTWIHSYTNEAGKLEFKIPMNADETYVPCVAVSNSYYKKYLSGQNSLARAFYPRQFELDREARTLVTGDYGFSKELEITNNVKMFKVNGAKLDTVGGPNSNNYAANLVLTMGSESFDQMYVGRIADAEAATETAALTDSTFTVPVKWVETFGDPETLKSLVGEPFIASFHSVKNQAWYEREITIDEENGTLTINEVPADYTAVDEALAKVPEDLSIYTEESAKAVEDAVAAVDRTKTSKDQAAVDAMAKAIEDAVSKLEEKPAEPEKDADYTAVDAALAKVPKDMSGYTEETAKAVNDAVKAVQRGLKASDQDKVDAMAKAIEDAVSKLEEKPAEPEKDADYTAVDVALAKVPKDMSGYTEETVKAVNDAVSAVKRGLKASEQFKVNAMAKAIEDAVSKLEEKPAEPEKDADYTAVDAALEKVPKDMSGYTEETVKAVNDAVSAIKRGLKASEQFKVNAMAKAIEDAVNGLANKPSPTPAPNPDNNSGNSGSSNSGSNSANSGSGRQAGAINGNTGATTSSSGAANAANSSANTITNASADTAATVTAVAAEKEKDAVSVEESANSSNTDSEAIAEEEAPLANGTKSPMNWLLPVLALIAAAILLFILFKRRKKDDER